MENKKYLLSNGTSISAGGGFEPYDIRKNVRAAYKAKGITLADSRVECSFPHFVSKNLDLELISLAGEGTSASKLIRTTYDWMNKNKSKVNETIFLFEFNLGLFIDTYVNEYKKYFIINGNVGENGKIPIDIINGWWKPDEEINRELQRKYQIAAQSYVDNFFNMTEFVKNEKRNIETFLSYCKLNDLDFYYCINFNDYGYFNTNTKLYGKHLLNDLFNGMDVWRWCIVNKLLISDEIGITDNHLGYSANISIAEKISNHITLNK
jgi:hypothetical protein